MYDTFCKEHKISLIYLKYTTSLNVNLQDLKYIRLIWISRN